MNQENKANTAKSKPKSGSRNNNRRNDSKRKNDNKRNGDAKKNNDQKRNNDNKRNPNNKNSNKNSNKNNNNNRRNKRGRNSSQQKKKEVKFTDKLSEHFTKKDFVCKESGQLKLSLGLVGALELLQAKTETPIKIIKGFESLEVAEKRHDFKRNYHTQGLAADIQIEGLSPKELFLLAEEIDEIMGIGLNLEENYVHVDTRKADERVLWVEIKTDKIDITEKTRSTYL